MYKKVLNILYNSGIYLLVTFATLLVVTSAMWLLNLELLWLNFILSIIISGIICYKFCDGDIKQKLISLFIAFLALTASILISGHVYDQSDDGNTYHKETVSMIESGWNPIYDDYEKYALKNDLESNHGMWAKHYPKTTWIMAATMYQITDNVETSKFYNIIFIYIAFVITSYLLYQLKNNKFYNWLIALTIVINPITIVQALSFYVDGFMGLLMYLIIFYMILFIKNDKDKLVKLILASLIILITNVKFTGLAYCGVFCLAYFIYYSIIKIKNRDIKSIINNIFYFGGVVLISVLLVGSTSYLKNTITKGNPLYPLMGEGKVDIMTYLQPASFAQRSSFEKNFYAIFSKSANIGVFNNGEPELKMPFTYDQNEIKQLSYDTRIGGYGVLFSGVFIISIILLTILITVSLMKKDNDIILYIIPLVVTIGFMIFLSDSWWARYAPQLYLFVIIPLILMYKNSSILEKITVSVFVGLILYNTILCFSTFYKRDLPISGMARMELAKNENKKLKIYFSADRFTGICANLRDRNIKYELTTTKEEEMKSLYGNFAYYKIINEKED